jgi:hypothetical protein
MDGSNSNPRRDATVKVTITAMRLDHAEGRLSFVWLDSCLITPKLLLMGGEPRVPGFNAKNSRKDVGRFKTKLICAKSYQHVLSRG